MIKLNFFIYTIFILNSIGAQISQGGLPRSFELNLRDNVEIKYADKINVEELIIEDEESDKDTPFRFGYDIPTKINLLNSGTWEILNNGDKIWRIKIVSENAFSINLIFDYYYLPPESELFVYSENYEMVLGAFTNANNKEYGGMATSPIAGDAIYLEYYEPNNVEFIGQLSISHIVHGYKDVFFNSNRDYGDSGSCNNNVNCSEGDPWEDEIRSVAMILTSNGSRLCTGSMVNNVNQDLTPYFLTANHCIYGNTDSWIIMFNYESSGCTNQNGPTNMTVQGTTLKSNGSGSDYALFELSENPPENYEIHYAGWSAVDVAPPQPVAIHHPSGDIKKISFDYDTGISDGWSGNDGSHWRVADWEDGTTEPGSSGSPLFDSDHRIVGQLHGGEASCSYNVNDYYGKFSTSWNSGLSTWLDPNNTGTLVLDGIDAIDIPDPELTYDMEMFDFELGSGESELDYINITNTGEAESILTYNLNVSPFESPSDGPDNNDNFWTDSDNEPNLSYDWIDISNTGIQYDFSNNDDAGSTINIGFDFDFYGQSYSQCIINPNGWVGFGSDNDEWENSQIPSSSAPSPAIFGFWDDLNPVNDNCNEYCSGNVYYHSNSDRMVIWFNEVAHWWTNFENSFYDFQIVLYSTGEIRVNYNTMTGNYESGTIGMQNANGTIGFEMSFNDSYVHNELSISFKQSPEWLELLSSSSGELSFQESNQILFSIDTSNLYSSEYISFLTINSNGGNGEVSIYLDVNDNDVLLGDINFDNDINIQDIVILINFVIGSSTPNELEFISADINTDNILNVLDVVQLVNIILS